MAFVRRRTTRAGSLSTTLVEAYRDADGRPRQRIIANLHGAPDTLNALVRLAYQRESLLKHKQDELANASQYSKKVTAQFCAAVDRDLKRLQKTIDTIEQHCTASAGEIRAAYKQYRKQLHDAEAKAYGTLLRKFELEDTAKAAQKDFWRLRGF
jgi:hypothetical protein